MKAGSLHYQSQESEWYRDKKGVAPLSTSQDHLDPGMRQLDLPHQSHTANPPAFLAHRPTYAAACPRQAKSSPKLPARRLPPSHRRIYIPRVSASEPTNTQILFSPEQQRHNKKAPPRKPAQTCTTKAQSADQARSGPPVKSWMQFSRFFR